VYRCSSERDQELIQHRRLLHDAEQASLTKTQAVADLQDELQDRGMKLVDRENNIANLLTQIHELQLLQAPAPVADPAAPTANPVEAAPSFDVEDD
jgi:hypothetical protein